MDRENRRSTSRTDIDISTLPFFGFHTQDDFALEYFLINLSDQGLQIRVVPYGEERRLVKAGDRIRLHLALRSHKGMFDHGRIMWSEYDKEKDLLVCGMSLEKVPKPKYAHSFSPFYPVSLSPETSDIFLEATSCDSADDLLLHIILESSEIKVKMSEALFGTVPCVAARASSGKHTRSFLVSLTESLNEDSRRLRVWYEMIQREMVSQKPTPIAGGLSDLRSLIRSDVSARLKKIELSDALKKRVLPETRGLEEQLLVNTNTVGLLWLGYLAYMYQNVSCPT